MCPRTLQAAISNRRAVIAVITSLFAVVVQILTTAAAPPIVVDDFTNASRWKVVASDGVELKCSAVHDAGAGDEHASPARLDINFVSGGGYGGIRRELPLGLPANFELTFSIRGDLPPNNLEFKLVDSTGQNVWWINRRAFEFPHDWTRLASRRRHFQFAWGPSGAPLTQAAAVEIVISSVHGGHGTIYLDDLAIRPLPESKPYSGTPTITTSSSAGQHTLSEFASDEKLQTNWQSADGDHKPALTIDFGATREFGGLVVEWAPAAFAPSYDVQFSDDNENWASVRTVSVNTGRRQYISLPDSEARTIRLAMRPPDKSGHVSIREIEVLPLDVSRDANTFSTEIARRSPRGQFPRPFTGEGTFWTVVGAPADEHEALVSEDGSAEVDKQSFTIEPFLYVDHQLLSWANASTTQSLAKGFAPVPTVTRNYDGLKLTVTAAADGERDDSSLLLNYSVTNSTWKRLEGSLYLTIRPFQVNPSYQSLNSPGGVARIDHIAIRDSNRVVDVDDRAIALGAPPADFGCAAFDEGDISSFIDEGHLPPHATVSDPQRTASATLAYHFDLNPSESRSWVVAIPFSRNKERIDQLAQPLLSAADPVEFFRNREAAVVDQWTKATASYELLLPAEATDIANTIRSTLAYILINRDGPAIQPGSRSYERSWIRDGSLTATALLRFGLDQPARQFVDWYAPYQFESGKVPCVVDHRGPDPVPENDSHGQLILAVMNVYRFTGDKNFLEQHWPQVEKAVAYIEKLRAERMTPEFADSQTSKTRQEPDKPAVNLHAFYGLMPESISHEGYSAKPMHSYWDDFFTLKGLKDAAEIAGILGHDSEAKQFKTFADEFASTLYASINQAMQTHKIDYVPGCVELGDFDATSTTIALWPCGEIGRLPRPALDRTFELYWEHFVRRRDDPSFAWTDYTPYELRCVGSFVLLGKPDRAQQALQFFLHDRRPPAWNQWPEVVYRAPRTPKFLGDLPHTWCGSDFLNSVRMMFLYEREENDTLVLLAGVPESWISSTPIGFRNMPTSGGRISCTMERKKEISDRLVANIFGTCPVPGGGIRVTLPASATHAKVNTSPAELDADGRVILRQLPAIVEADLSSDKQ
jgi:F5/8 type C domain/Bacterial alpha-L-rhamnosidase 6 hairpin glycosidase domain